MGAHQLHLERARALGASAPSHGIKDFCWSPKHPASWAGHVLYVGAGICQRREPEPVISSICVFLRWLRCSMWLTNLVWDERTTLGRVWPSMQTRKALHHAQGREWCAKHAICEWTDCQCVLLKTAGTGAFWLAPLLDVDAHQFYQELARGSRSQRSLQFLFLSVGHIARCRRSPVSSGTGASPWGKCALPAGPE